MPGHWEGDLIGGFWNSYAATLVERNSYCEMLVKVANKDTESFVTALIKQLKKLPGELYQSLTSGRGTGLSRTQIGLTKPTISYWDARRMGKCKIWWRV